jgi:hypothetical protein
MGAHGVQEGSVNACGAHQFFSSMCRGQAQSPSGRVLPRSSRSMK